MKDEGVLVLMPTPGVVSAGPLAVWLEAAGWASAAEARFGNAWVVTPDGILNAEQTRSVATRRPGRIGSRAGWQRHLPAPLATLRKDVRDLGRGVRFARAGLEGPWAGKKLRFIWQHHELFQWPGFIASRRFDAPVVLYLDAPIVWEARKWGVTRPGWGRALENIAERPQLRRARVVACVSEEVADEAIRLGAPPDRTLVTPCAVDTEAFSPKVSGAAVRERYGLNESTVVGWLGSFRRFHGIDMLLRSFRKVQEDHPQAALLLCGEGLERRSIQAQAKDLGIRAVFTGMVPHDEVPAHLRAMDVGVVVDPGGQSFHYSPLKLQEYMACGIAVIAPSSGQVREILQHEHTGLLTASGNEAELEAALNRLVGDAGLRERLGREARAAVEHSGTWAARLDRVMEVLAV